MTDNIVPFPTFAVELARACEQADEYEAALWQLVGAIERMSAGKEERKEWLKTACSELRILLN
jgi:hypothetical protein